MFTCRQCLNGERCEAITLPVLIFCVVSELLVSSQFLYLKALVVLSKNSRSIQWVTILGHVTFLHLQCFIAQDGHYNTKCFTVCFAKWYFILFFILYFILLSLNFWFQVGNLFSFAQCTLCIFRGLQLQEGLQWLETESVQVSYQTKIRKFFCFLSILCLAISNSF